METINHDILYCIAIKLELNDLLRFSMVGKRIYNIINRDNIWMYKLSQEFPKYRTLITHFFYSSVKKLYIRIYYLSILNNKLQLNYDIYELFDFEIKYLDVNIKNIKEFPKEIKYLCVENINAINNGIETVPDEILELDMLVYLNMTHNKIVKFPLKMCNMTNLKELYLNKNFIKEISIDLPNLTELNLAHNKLEKISFNNMTNLKRLSLEHNWLTSIDIISLVNLSRLNLSNNLIEEINIENFSELNYLNLSNNHIKDLYIENLPDLLTFICSNNYITTISKNIGSLFNLRILDLDNNFIEEVPKEIGNLRNLERLDLQNNNIKELPDEMRQLRSLENIDVSGNGI